RGIEHPQRRSQLALAGALEVVLGIRLAESNALVGLHRNAGRRVGNAVPQRGRGERSGSRHIARRGWGDRGACHEREEQEGAGEEGLEHRRYLIPMLEPARAPRKRFRLRGGLRGREELSLEIRGRKRTREEKPLRLLTASRAQPLELPGT